MNESPLVEGAFILRYTGLMPTIVIAAIIGLCMGSFFSVVLTRLGREEGIVRGRSRCPSCRLPLRWFELIPFVSFIIQRGRCRRCRGRISWMYPLVELASGGLVVGFALVFGPAYSLPEIVSVVLGLGFLLLAFFDAREYIVPDIVLLAMGALWLVYALMVDPSLLLRHAPIAFVLAGVFGILYLVSRGRWVGLGDVKLLLLIGFVFGYPFAGIITVLAVWAAVAAGITMVITRGATLKTPLPFGAFVAGMAILALLYYAPLRIFTGLF